MRMKIERDGKMITLNSYSLLQDRYFEHMKAAGFDGFERGERGSTTEHLEVLDYKIQQDTIHAAELDKDISRKQKKVKVLDKKLAVQEKAAVDISILDSIGQRKNIMGQFTITPEELKNVIAIVKRAAKSEEKAPALVANNKALSGEVASLKKQIEGYEGKGITDTIQYYHARQRAPQRMAAAISDIMRYPPEIASPEKAHQHSQQKHKSHGEVL